MTRRRRSRSRGWRKRPSVRSTSTFPASATFSTSLFLSAAGRCWPLSTHRRRLARRIFRCARTLRRLLSVPSPRSLHSRALSAGDRGHESDEHRQALWSSGHAPVKQGIRRFLEQGAALGHVVCADLDWALEAYFDRLTGWLLLGQLLRAEPPPDPTALRGRAAAAAVCSDFRRRTMALSVARRRRPQADGAARTIA